ncbi:MAG: hypothetical protein ABIO70_09440 [Pseudomonadota bacterium]
MVGLVVLAGWALDLAPLKSVLPGLVTMKANTALGFLLGGGALALCTGNVPPWRRALALGLAGLCLLLGLAPVSQDLFGRILGIDQIPFQEPAGATFTAHPGRMAWPTALCFMALGGGLWMLPVRRAVPLVHLLAAGVGIAALQAIVRHLFGQPGTLFCCRRNGAFHARIRRQ